MKKLYLFNPWWEIDDWEKKDKHLTEFNSMIVRWVTDWIKEISLKPLSLNFVTT